MSAYNYNAKVYSKEFYDMVLKNETVYKLAVEKFEKVYTNPSYRPAFETQRDYYTKQALSELGHNIDSLYFYFNMKELWS